MDSKVRLQLDDVTYVYHGETKAAVDGVSFTLSAGHCLGLIGPNGAGKSTLLRLAAGLLAPSSGTTRLDGRPVDELRARERGRLLAYVPQTFALPFTYRVLEVVLQGRFPHLGRSTFETQRDLDIARASMERTGVWELRERPFDALSGGERQRTVIASALTQEPRLLILDEPTSSLDLRFQNTTVRLVRELVSQDQLAVLVALHDLNLASAMCDELALLVGGSLQVTGAPEEVLERKILEDAYQTELLVGDGPGGRYVLPLP